MEKAELIITALQQRIGELVSNYETQIAVLRAELTQYAQQAENKQKAIDEYSQTLSEKATATNN
jgi:flagellar biosynthesis chaperone FliJ